MPTPVKHLPDAVRELANTSTRVVSMTSSTISPFKKEGFFTLNVLIPEVNIVTGIPFLFGAVHTDFSSSLVRKALEVTLSQQKGASLNQLITGVFLAVRPFVSFDLSDINREVPDRPKNDPSLISLRYHGDDLENIRSTPYGAKLSAWINGEPVYTAEYTPDN